MRVGITGHRGLGEPTERMVRAALRRELGAFEATELRLVSCLADGPDSWAAEAALERGGRVEVVVPAVRYRQGLPEEHHATYDRLLAAAWSIGSSPCGTAGLPVGTGGPATSSSTPGAWAYP